MVKQLLELFPYMAQDNDIMPLIQRLSVIERLLRISHEVTVQNKLLQKEEVVRNRIFSILRDRAMQESIDRIQRGKRLLKIPTTE